MINIVMKKNTVCSKSSPPFLRRGNPAESGMGWSFQFINIVF